MIPYEAFFASLEQSEEQVADILRVIANERKEALMIDLETGEDIEAKTPISHVVDLKDRPPRYAVRATLYDGDRFRDRVWTPRDFADRLAEDVSEYGLIVLDGEVIRRGEARFSMESAKRLTQVLGGKIEFTNCGLIPNPPMDTKRGRTRFDFTLVPDYAQFIRRDEWYYFW